MITYEKQRRNYDADTFKKERLVDEFYKYPFVLLFRENIQGKKELTLVNDVFFFDKPMVVKEDLKMYDSSDFSLKG